MFEKGILAEGGAGMALSSWAVRCGKSLFLVALMAGATYGQNIVPGTLTTPPQLKLITTLTPQSAGAPDFGVSCGDPRFMYIGEQNGRVRTLDFSQGNPLLGTDFLD